MINLLKKKKVKIGKRNVTLACDITPLECVKDEVSQFWGKEQTHDVLGSVLARGYIHFFEKIKIPHFFES